MPNLNAGFVDVGHGKDAFLHHQDLGPQFKTQQIWVKRVMSGKQPTATSVNSSGNQTLSARAR